VGATQCAGLEIQTCTASGTWANTTACAVGCASSACLSVSAIAAGGNHTCALLSNSTVECWGSNTSSQLGTGSSSSPNAPNPVVVAGLTGVTAISAGDAFTCALLSAGTVKCWGSNASGQLGNASTSNSPTPVTATGLSGVTALAAGGADTCVVMPNASYTVDCWGANAGNMLSSTSGNVTTPLAISGLNDAVPLSVGQNFLCGVVAISGGAVECLGSNTDGQLGQGTTGGNPATVPQTLNLSGATAIAAGGDEGSHACAIASGGAQCWGDNEYGEVGNGSTSATIPSPAAVSGLSTGVSAISVGNYHTCALLSGGTVKCWGYNTYGELGNGLVTASSVPVAASTLTGVTAISAGGLHTCAITSAGQAVQCWGYNASGQIGNSSTATAMTPTPVVW
jgi:alpha-tubulin suppressor-like RCC1 family protein